MCRVWLLAGLGCVPMSWHVGLGCGCAGTVHVLVWGTAEPLGHCCDTALSPVSQLYEVSTDTTFAQPSDAACDVACFIYTLSDPKSFSYCASIYKVPAGTLLGSWAIAGVLFDFIRGMRAISLCGSPVSPRGWSITPHWGFSVSAATLPGQPDPLCLRGLQDRPARSQPAARNLPS